MRVKSNVYINLTKEMLWKLEVIQRSIEEQVSRKTMLEGGIDLMFSTALKVLYREQQITDEEMQEGLEHIPHFLAAMVCKRTGWKAPDK
ncbi:MAG TPA: hypothetical protein QGF70_02440 [Candidatus Thalassarchaeaceae archaeon]|nr:hypothetical protein [Candidatus Thalassarchaeaceae archaeon]